MENDYLFIVEELLDGREPVTDQMIQLLIEEDQKKLLVSLIAIPKNLENRACRPRYLPVESKKYTDAVRAIHSDFKDRKDSKVDVFYGERELHFLDILVCALDGNAKSKDIIELLKLMSAEVMQGSLADGRD